MSTVLTYNTITLSLIKTNLIRREPVYSADGTEYLYTHWSLDVTGILNPGLDEGFTPGATDVLIRASLAEPRQQLTYTVGADTVLSCPANGFTTDANNGPRPFKFNVTRITGSTTFHVEFGVECWVIECNQNSPPAIISNRWQSVDQVDEDFLTTKIYRGIAVFRTDMLTLLGNSPDHYRNQIFPPIQLGFKRVQINAIMHPSINSLSYEVIDREQTVYLGDQHSKYGVTRFEGWYQTSTISNTEGGAGSGMVLAKIDVNVWGEKDTTNWQLVLFAMQVIYQKLQLDGSVDPIPTLKNVAIRKALHARMIQATAEVLINPSQDINGISILNMLQLEKDDLDIFVKDWTNPQPYDAGTRGSHRWEMLAQQFREVCQKAPALLARQQDNDSDEPYDITDPTTVNISVSDSLPYYQSNQYSSDVYHDYRVDVAYVTDYNYIQAPVASSTPAVSVLQVAAPVSKKIVTWTAERPGSPPTMPLAQTTDSTLTLLSAQVTPTVPGLMADTSTPIYKASGVYTYAWNGYISDQTLTTGIVPWTTLNFSDGEYGTWSSEIIDAIDNESGSTQGNAN